VKLVEQWRRVEEELPAGWTAATLDVVPETASDRARAAALLGPANPGRVGEALRVRVARGGAAVGPEALRNLLGRLDEARIWCSLRLVESAVPAEPATAEARDAETTLAAGWDALVATLPPDWSDLYAELRLASTDYLPRAALLCAPLNPTRAPGTAFTFRAARRAGYGASPQMVRRCLERCDAERMRGAVVALRVLSETRNVATQGPVWRVGGRSV
jgi:hypothetical protein